MEFNRRALLRYTSSAGLASAAVAGASIGAPAAQAASGVVNPRQFRGVWVATVGNLDWPRAQGLSAAQQKQQFQSVLSTAARYRLNAVISQVRPAADTFWPSKREPWSKYLTGTQGKSPGYDPLAYQIQQTHARGMEFHAWINPFRVSSSGKLTDLAPSHPARKHPDWVISYNGKLYYNPGIPAVRAHVSAVVMEMVATYDIDAVHFDDYFYPYPVDGRSIDDRAAFKKYGKGSLAQWRRSNINTFVQSISSQIHRKKSWVKFGISPFGIWRNRSSTSLGSRTNGLESYSAIYADTRLWVKKGWIDYIAPQIYWENGNGRADYLTLATWWADVVKGTKVSLYIGQAAYKYADGSFTKSAELANHVAQDAKIPQITGEILFSHSDVVKNSKGGVDRLRTGAFARPALVPVTPSRRGKAPAAPTKVSVKKTSKSHTVSFDAGSSPLVAIWRVRGRAFRASDVNDARNLVAVIRSRGRGTQSYTDTSAQHVGNYAVTTLDRLWTQSGVALPRPGLGAGTKDRGMTGGVRQP